MEEIAITTSITSHPKQKLKKKRGPRRHYKRRFPVRLKPDEIELLKLRAEKAGMSLSRSRAAIRWRLPRQILRSSLVLALRFWRCLQAPPEGTQGATRSTK